MKPNYWKIGVAVFALVALATLLSPRWQGEWSDTAPVLKTQLFRP